MSVLPRAIYKFLLAANRGWYRLLLRLGLRSRRPVTVATYRGFARADYLFLTGRVQRDNAIVSSHTDGSWRNLVNNLKRFYSREIHDAELEVSFGDHHFQLQTDVEGYFRIDQQLLPPLVLDPTQGPWHTAQVLVRRVPGENADVCATAEVLIPHQAAFGVISDIDDTILKTDVTSLLKLRTAYLTLLKNAGSRLAFRQVSAFCRCLREGPGSRHNNPFFYVSNSPWNLYDLLTEFLDLNELPRGPILLRDFGIPYEHRPAGYPGHKYAKISQIMEAYPDLPFVLIGDTAEKDTDIYLAIARNYPRRVLAIYIRDVLSGPRARRVSRLLRQSAEAPALLVRHYDEAARHAADLGLCEWSTFETLSRHRFL